MSKRQLTHFLTAAAFSIFASSASAVPINLSLELTGDPRPGNPNGLNVDVTIVGDTASNTATFTVNLDMAATHPNARLGEFGFNLDKQLAETFAITAITNPAGWSVLSDVQENDLLQGGGNMTFLLTLEDPSGGANNVTNADSTNLIFTLTKLTGGFFTASDFLNAPQSCSNDAQLGCGQMGAHIQSLVAGQGESDSGIALGAFNGTLPPGQISEPGMLALGGFGLLMLGLMRRRST